MIGSTLTSIPCLLNIWNVVLGEGMGKEVVRGSSRVRYLGLLGSRGNGELRITVRPHSLSLRLYSEDWVSERRAGSCTGINLHTGFTWLGTGSFFPRRFSSNFLQQQSYLSQLSLVHPSLDLILHESETLVSDMFFSIWTNTYPEQWSVELVEIDVEGGEVGWSKTEGRDQWKIVYENLVCLPLDLSSSPTDDRDQKQLKAYRILTVALLNSPDSPTSPFPSISADTLFPESHSRAPCSNDHCLFITNLSPFPSPTEIDPIFNDAINSQQKSGWLGGKKKEKGLKGLTGGFDPYKITHLKEYEQLWSLLADASPFPSVEAFLSSSWHHSVDSLASTCFTSHRPLQPLDYFGLTFLQGRVVRRVEIEGEGLGGVVSWDEEDEVLERGEEGWVVMTERWNGGGGWVSPSLFTLDRPKKPKPAGDE